MKTARARKLACALLSPPLVALGASCSTNRSDINSLSRTNLYADPDAFRGEIPCQRYEGALRSYVVTLIEVTARVERDGVTVDEPVGAYVPVSSPPVPCTQRAGFSDKVLTPGHGYSALVDAYDYPACDAAASARPCIVPYNGIASPGGRAMALVLPGDAVPPGDPSWAPLRAAAPPPEWPPVECAAVRAEQYASRPFNSCGPALEPRWPDGGLALSVDALRGALPCAPAEGNAVGSIFVEYTGIVDASGAYDGGAGAGGGGGQGGGPGGGAAGGPEAGAAGQGGGPEAGAAGQGGGQAAVKEPAQKVREIACATGAELRYERGELTPGITYGFRASALDGAGVLRWSSSCTGTPVAGINNFPVECEPLRDDGALTIAFATLAGAYAERFGAPPPPCATTPDGTDAALLGVEVALGGQGPLQRVACGNDLRFDRLLPGAYTLRGAFNVRAAGAAQVEARPFVCEGFVAGGSPTAVRCQFL